MAACSLVALGLLAAACSPASTATSPPPKATALSRAGASPTALFHDHQVWLCRPGVSPDPCTEALTATAVAADGTRTIEHARAAVSPKIDCFYVYPTVSAEKGISANLKVQPEETSVAHEQASRYSQECRVFAPMYRQVTLAGLFNQSRTAGKRARTLAYTSVLKAWKDYLAHYSDGRGFVLIGHSQGAFVLEELIKNEIDKNPTLRKRLVSAILLGGNVVVPKGRDVGGTFEHVPACRSDSETGCVIAYSSFNNPPPPNSLFGRTRSRGDQVLCTNPAALGGGSGALSPYLPTHISGVFTAVGTVPNVSTPWVTYPDQFTGECTSANGASWLQITPVAGTSQLVLTDALGPQWGLHLYDANIALGNLVSIVGTEARAYSASG